MPSRNEAIVGDALRKARRIIAITGAGISAESGIPTFRDAGGWWKQISPEKLATREAFSRDPVEVWQWYSMRRELVARAQPNRGHLALARAERQGRDISIVTQNVDDLHERAGSSVTIHVHGSLWKLRCTIDGTVFEDRRVPLPVIPPRCPNGHLARPDVVWWDEDLDASVVERIETALDEPFDVALVVGTEATFEYIRHWALRAKRSGALLVEVNPMATALTPTVDVRIGGPAGEVLDAIFP